MYIRVNNRSTGLFKVLTEPLCVSLDLGLRQGRHFSSVVDFVIRTCETAAVGGLSFMAEWQFSVKQTLRYVTACVCYGGPPSPCPHTHTNTHTAEPVLTLTITLPLGGCLFMAQLMGDDGEPLVLVEVEPTMMMWIRTI